MSVKTLTKDLNSILNSFVDLIGCDGGSIYTLETNSEGRSVLVFKAMVTRSVGIHAVPDKLKDLIFELDEQSLVGRTGFHQKVFKENYHQLISQLYSQLLVILSIIKILSINICVPTMVFLN